MPRPSKITQERIDAITGAIQNGHYKITAAGLAGIDRQTLDNWLAKGESEANEKPLNPEDFSKPELITEAESRGIIPIGTKAKIAEAINGQRSMFLDLFDAYKKAYAEGEALALSEAVRTGREDWHFWMTYLERTRPQRWGRRQRLEDEIDDEEMLEMAGDEADAQRAIDRATEITIKIKQIESGAG